MKRLKGGYNFKMENPLSSLSDRAFEFEAYIPVYDNGNVVIAITRDGQDVRIDKSIRSLLNSLLRKNSIDIHLLRKNLSEYTERKIFIPIPLSADIVLIPVKVRKTIIANDGAYAYVDLYSIEKVYGDKDCKIALRCGREITSLESEKAVYSRMKAGSIILNEFSSRLLCGGSLKEQMSGLTHSMDKPLTKRDMYLMAYEIMKLLNSSHMS